MRRIFDGLILTTFRIHCRYMGTKEQSENADQWGIILKSTFGCCKKNKYDEYTKFMLSIIAIVTYM